MGVDAKHTAFHLARDSQGPLEIVGPNRAAQPVRRIVHFLDHFALVIERPDAHYRAEDFFAPAPVTGFDFKQHSGGQVKAFCLRTSAAASDGTARLSRFADEVLGYLSLAGGDQRSDLGRFETLIVDTQ